MRLSLSAALASLGLAVLSAWSAGIVCSPASAETFDLFPTPSSNSGPQGITSGPDGHLWFAEADANKIGRLTLQGVFTEFPVPTPGGRPFGIAAGPDGNVWFTEVLGNKIGRITPDGTITEFPIPTASSLPVGIALGPDGNMWFTESNKNKVARITTVATGATPAGTITEFTLPTPLNGPYFITRGADGRMWFTENFSNKIGRITTDGTTITEFPIPTPDSQPIGIVAGPDGNVWFTEFGSGKLAKITPGGLITETFGADMGLGITINRDGHVWVVSQSNKIGSTWLKIDPMVGTFGYFTVPVTNATTQFVTLGADGNLWFTITSSVGNNFIGRLVTDPAFTSVAASILPSSRSVQVGNVATVFASVINFDSMPLTSCGIAPVTPVSGDFSFQTTNPQTNQLTGTLNARVTIPAGGLQTFVIAYKANGPFPPTDVQLGFVCSDGYPATTIVGVDTWRLTFSTTPVADMIAVGATLSGDGVAFIDEATHSSVFAIATANIGAATQLTGRVRFSDPSLPLTATVCETNPATAACKQPATPSVTRTFAHDETATFTVFLQATGNVPPDYANNRVLLEFVDAIGVVRGSTSAAVASLQ